MNKVCQSPMLPRRNFVLSQKNLTSARKNIQSGASGDTTGLHSYSRKTPTTATKASENTMLNSTVNPATSSSQATFNAYNVVRKIKTSGQTQRNIKNQWMSDFYHQKGGDSSSTRKFSNQSHSLKAFVGEFSQKHNQNNCNNSNAIKSNKQEQNKAYVIY